MVIQSIGYGGTVTEDNTSLWLPDAGGVPYTVDGIDGFAPSVNTGTARAVTVKAGMAAGCGIRDVMDEDAVVTFDEVTSGVRWDMLVLRRSWAGAGGATALAVVKGTSSQNATFGTRNQDPGTVDDQPIALVQITAGQTQPTNLIDLRVWRGLGGAVAASDSVRQYITAVGARLLIGYPPLEWVRVINPATGAPVWTIYRVDAASQVNGILPMRNGGLGAIIPERARLELGFGIPAGPIPLLAGGNAATARSALGLGGTTGPVPIANGGTGASTVAGARNALGLGNTGGVLPVANGGTGAAHTNTARKSLGFAGGQVELTTSGETTISTGLSGPIVVTLTIQGQEFAAGMVAWVTWKSASSGSFRAQLIGTAAGRQRTVNWIAMETS